MRRLPVLTMASTLLACAALVSTPLTARAEPPKAQKITFETYDKVQIQGSFYPSTNDGTKSPTVMLLHKIGGNRNQDGWEGLAQALQDKGFAVLSFDFRGHGDSTTVKPKEFWSVNHNRNGIRGNSQGKESINVKDFTPSYYGMLVNDIAAAKVALEQKNNAKDCNVGDLIVVGAEDGAGLGLVWMATEWARRKRTVNPAGFPIAGTEPEGRDLAGAVCLSLKANFGTGTTGLKLPTSQTFSNAKMREMPICFFYGDEDTVSRDFAKYIYDRVLNADKLKLKLTFQIPLKGTKLAGHELLGKQALKTEDAVATYLKDKVMEARGGKVWTERDLKFDEKLNPLIAVPVDRFGVSLP